MREFRCHICDGMAYDYCIVCNRPVCSICSNDAGICRRCRFISSDASSSGISIGHAQARSIINMPLMLIGIAMIVIGMMVISYALSSTNIRDIAQGQGNSNGSGGVIVVFPFPFIIYTPDATTAIFMLIATILIPFLLLFWLMKRTI
jgi:uncharacterized membrane protein